MSINMQSKINLKSGSQSAMGVKELSKNVTCWEIRKGFVQEITIEYLIPTDRLQEAG